MDDKKALKQLDSLNVETPQEPEFLPLPERICRQQRMYEQPYAMKSSDTRLWTHLKQKIRRLLFKVQ